MKVGLYAAVADIPSVLGSGLDFVETNVQSFLQPQEMEPEFDKFLKKHLPKNVPVSVGNGLLPPTLPCVGPEADLDQLLTYAEIVFIRARRVGINTIIFGSGKSRQIPSDFPAIVAIEQFIDVLHCFGSVAERHGVTVMLKPLHRSQCNLINSLIEGATVVQKCNHANVRLAVDLFQLLAAEKTTSAIERFADCIGYVHIGAHGILTSKGSITEDYRPYLRALMAAKYKGSISVHYSWKDVSAETPRTIASLREQIADASSK